jgi:uncharacterized protein YjbJ (UPF0337 family)
VGQAKDKLGEQHGDQDRGQGGISGDLRDKASDAVQDAKDRFGG